MLFKLMLLFILVPIIEFILLSMVRELTNLPATIGLVVATGVLGAWLAKGQGVAALRRVRESMTNAQVPTAPLLDAALIFFAGGLLLTPGVLTDFVGISIMIPKCREWYRRQLIAWFKRNFSVNIKSTFTDPNVVDSYVVDPDEGAKPKEADPPPNHDGFIE